MYDGHYVHIGFASSHFFFLRRHVLQPVFDLALVIFVGAIDGEDGCFLGRPLRFLASVTAPCCVSTLISGLFEASVLLISSIEVSSSSSVFGTMAKAGSGIKSSPSVSDDDDEHGSEPLVDADRDDVLDGSVGERIEVFTSRG